MTQAEKGNTVKVHYTGKLTDGTEFDSSQGRDPLEFVLGSGQIIPGFDEAVTGMTPGDSTTVNIPPDQAYGPRQEELMLEVERSKLPAHLDPEIGQRLELHQPDGQAVPVVITDITDDDVTLDANHPLAGEELIFDIQLVEIA